MKDWPVRQMRPRSHGKLLPRLAAAGLLLLASCAAGPALVDEDPATGFALYRSGRLGAAELAELCRLGVEEMVVLDGGGARECALRERLCPGLRLRYDQAQSAHRPVSATFLGAFDAWIDEARRAGRKVAFRCRHGWHRAGRLAAWYRIRFQGMSAAEAIAEMQRRGRFMWRHPQLVPQVEAMADRLAGRPCSTAPEHCVQQPTEPAAATPFPPDVCR